MPVITIDDVIGFWNMDARWLKDKLDAAEGQDIRVDISSPGGLVFEGIKMFNLLKDYPGQVTTRIDGLAASMASYLAQAGDHRQAMSNGVFMIHNAWGLAIGDHRDFRHEANILQGLSSSLSRAYVVGSGKTPEEITALMDAESWFFGDEIVDAGFADELIDAVGTAKSSKIEAVALGRASFTSGMDRVRADQARVKSDLAEAAAWLKPGQAPPKMEAKPITTEKPEAKAPVKNKGGHKVAELNKATLKRDNPDLYASIVQEGADQEKTRCNQLINWKSTEKSAVIILEAIQAGSTYQDVMPQLVAEQTHQNYKKETEEENPPEINGSIVDSEDPEVKPQGADTTDELSEEEYKTVLAEARKGL